MSHGYQDGVELAKIHFRDGSTDKREMDMTYKDDHTSDLGVSPAFLSICADRRLTGTQTTRQGSVPRLHKVAD